MTALAKDPRTSTEGVSVGERERQYDLPGNVAPAETRISYFDVPVAVPVPPLRRRSLVQPIMAESIGALGEYVGTIIDRIAPVRTLALLGPNLGMPSRPPVSTPQPSNFAYSCVTDLSEWLGVSVSELTKALGISRATYYAWGARDSIPRVNTARQLYALHALASLVVDALGTTKARDWFNLGTPTMREEMLNAAGDREALSRVSDQVARTFASIKPPPVDRSLAARVRGVEGSAPDGPLEGW